MHIWKRDTLQQAESLHWFPTIWNEGYVFFSLFMAVPAAYGSFQARGQIRAVAEGYATATETPDPSHNMTYISQLMTTSDS